MNPTLRNMLLSEGIVKNGLVAEYRFNEGSGQVLQDYSDKSNHGQLGSTAGSDTNDPTWSSQGLSFATDDYCILPYMIDVQQDFTIYLVANVGAGLPSVIETYVSMGNSGSDTQYAYLRRLTNGTLGVYMKNNAGANASADIASPKSGTRLFCIKRSSDTLIFKDLISNESASTAIPANPITLNQIALGSFLRTSLMFYLNQFEYYALFYNRALLNSEDILNYRAIKNLLRKRGVSIG